MNESVKGILRKMGEDGPLHQDRDRWRKRAEEVASDHRSEGDKTEIQKKHDHFRRQQEFASRLGPAAERLPVMTSEEKERREKAKRPIKQHQFEGPIEKLIEKYRDLEEVFKHFSLGQLMKYELKEGKIYEKGELIYDGEKLVKK
ncbi:MAG: hypothetical protein EXS64_14535 [Candidatus Latescibacteria bacterium]|nr:hypothetical protein [Candidatus Latescibacterota bacterium]